MTRNVETDPSLTSPNGRVFFGKLVTFRKGTMNQVEPSNERCLQSSFRSVQLRRDYIFTRAANISFVSPLPSVWKICIFA